jgi:glycosyltransferase involved in cell wall biosynthesis
VLPTVLTVYDVMPLSSPRQFAAAKRLLLPAQYLRSMREATIILAISETTRRRLLAIDPSLESKIRVVPLGVSSELRDVAPDPVPGLGDTPFALVVGDLSPRKNVGMLLDIWEDVHRRTGMTLVVVGPEGWRSRATRHRLERLAHAGVARWFGRVPDAQLRWAYEHARVVLYPSVEEGYGLPIIEALEFGTPMITSTDDALVEVAAGRVRHVDAHDRAAWEDAVVEATSTGARVPGAARRGWADEISWSTTIDGTLSAYADALDAAASR